MDKRFLQNKIKKYTSKYNNLSRLMGGGHNFNVGDNIVYKTISLPSGAEMKTYGKINKVLAEDHYEILENSSGTPIEVNESDIVLDETRKHKYKIGDIVFNITKNKPCEIIGLMDNNRYLIECDKGYHVLCFESDLKDTHKFNVGDIVFDGTEYENVKIVSKNPINNGTVLRYRVVPVSRPNESSSLRKEEQLVKIFDKQTTINPTFKLNETVFDNKNNQKVFIEYFKGFNQYVVKTTDTNAMYEIDGHDLIRDNQKFKVGEIVFNGKTYENVKIFSYEGKNRYKISRLGQPYDESPKDIREEFLVRIPSDSTTFNPKFKLGENVIYDNEKVIYDENYNLKGTIVYYKNSNKYGVSYIYDNKKIVLDIDEKDLSYPKKEIPIKTLEETHKFKVGDTVFDNSGNTHDSMYGTITNILGPGKYMVNYGTTEKVADEKNLQASDFAFPTW